MISLQLKAPLDRFELPARHHQLVHRASAELEPTPQTSMRLGGERATASRLCEQELDLLRPVDVLVPVRLEPEGLAGIWRKSKRFWVNWPLSK